MKRLVRILSNAATILSLMLCVTVSALWVQSRRSDDGLRPSFAAHRIPTPTTWEEVAASRDDVYLLRITGFYVTEHPGRQHPVRLDHGSVTNWTEPTLLPYVWFQTYGSETRHGYGFAEVQRGRVAPRTFSTPWARREDWPTYSAVIVRFWFLAAASAVLPACRAAAYAVAWRRRRRRSATGRCRACGYDLRATPERCPECGTTPTMTPAGVSRP